MLSLDLQDVQKSFGNTEVIKSANLEIAAGEFVVFVGPSGCGKSTLLRLIAGLEAVSAGQVVVGGKDVTQLPPVERHVAMVFQSYALYPHMSVGENIAFPLKIAGMPKAERMAKAREAAKLLQLEPLFERKPRQLSGGQRQRVAIGRAIVKKPGIFLFDEPLSNLDAELRVQMRLELAKLHRNLAATMIYVTHDQVEAMTLADRIVVLRGGVIEQVGTPLELYHSPRNEFVAGFIGSPKMNFIDAVVEARDASQLSLRATSMGGLVFPIAASRSAARPGDRLRVGIRPDGIRLSNSPGIAAELLVAERLGNVNYLYANVGGQQLCIESKDGALAAGQTIQIAIDPSSAHTFSPAGDRV
ncbi:ABC transporter ATP-binding protein [Devosia sp. CN2-171]|uniref:ABC transporter ATP-binding protein n=1 Tax=Devosia sp. CN2-171 TaxID=3400909 RepID=UPI003BF91449